MARWSPRRRRRATEYHEERVAAPPQPRPFWPWLLLLLLLVLGALGASWYFANRDETVDAADVPNVVGAQQGEAERELEEREFVPEVKRTVSERPAGTVVAQRKKPQPVLDAMEELYETTYANVHRGVYELGAETTERYEGARAAVARFIGAGSEREIIFTKNVTEAINLVAYTWGRANLHAGDVVVLSHLEHHANIVPWLMLQHERDIEIRWIPLTPEFTLDLSHLDRTGRRRQARRCVGHVERARHAHADRRDRGGSPCGRCAVSRRRRATGAAPADERRPTRL